LTNGDPIRIVIRAPNDQAPGPAATSVANARINKLIVNNVIQAVALVALLPNSPLVLLSIFKPKQFPIFNNRRSVK
jgi:hypothetical protein